jgi:shikimate kinase
MDAVSQPSSTNTKPRRNLVLIGFMGTGKTCIGKLAARSLGWKFVDTDQRIVEAAGCPIAEIFADPERGEDWFRDLESRVLAEVLAEEEQVVATGGGVVVREGNRRVLAEGGYVFWLRASIDALYDRVRHNRNRPLLQTKDPKTTITKMLDEREPYYLESAHDQVDSTHLTAEETAYGITETARYVFG